jgi:raffinose/stachyose/melibiose transport system permease protein
VSISQTSRSDRRRQSAPARPGRPRKRHARITLPAVLFTLPALVIMVIFLVYPVIQNFRYSLTTWNGITPAVSVGLANYRELIGDALFRSVLQHTLELAIFGTAASVAIGVFWAYGIDRRLPGWRTYRFTLFVPVVMPITVSGLLWSLLLGNQGPTNTIAQDLGWKNPPIWLGDIHLTLWVVIGVSVWQAAGFTMLLMLGAMEDIPREQHEAASLDGASSLRRLVSIVLPNIRGTMAIVTVLQFISLLKAFDLVFAMTQGGPGNSTDVLGTYLYQESFGELRWGYGSAVAVTMTVLLFLLSFGLYRVLLRKETS